MIIGMLRKSAVNTAGALVPVSSVTRATVQPSLRSPRWAIVSCSLRSSAMVACPSATTTHRHGLLLFATGVSLPNHMLRRTPLAGRLVGLIASWRELGHVLGPADRRALPHRSLRSVHPARHRHHSRRVRPRPGRSSALVSEVPAQGYESRQLDAATCALRSLMLKSNRMRRLEMVSQRCSNNGQYGDAPRHSSLGAIFVSPGSAGYPHHRIG
jgi:hypothetical protein